MFRKHIKYVVVGMAIIPALWIISKAVMIKSSKPEDIVHLIARKQGWNTNNVEVLQRVRKVLDLNREPSDEDLQILFKAAEQENYGFGLTLIATFSGYSMGTNTDKYRSSYQKICERNMEQTEDRYAAILAYYGYIRSGGPDKEVWANRLKARGAFYVEQVAVQDSRAEKKNKAAAQRTFNSSP